MRSSLTRGDKAVYAEGRIVYGTIGQCFDGSRAEHRRHVESPGAARIRSASGPTAGAWTNGWGIMLKKAVVILVFLFLWAPCGFCIDTGLDEFALRSCLSNCSKHILRHQADGHNSMTVCLRCKREFEQRTKKNRGTRGN